MISEAYRALNADMHATDHSFGRMGQLYAPIVANFANKTGCESILDYGCGKSTLRDTLKWNGEFREYDPAIPGKDAPPQPADMVTCTDVLEHIEPEHLAAVLDDLHRLARKGFYGVIGTRPAIKLLPDGTNPHRIIEPPRWWLPLLMERWDPWLMEANPKRFQFFGVPRR